MNAPHGERVRELIRITQELLINKFGALKNNTAALAGSIAQRVNPDDKIESSIKYVQQYACRKLKLTRRLSRVIVEGCYALVFAVNNVLRAGDVAFLQMGPGGLMAWLP